jgi:hypothetical protein
MQTGDEIVHDIHVVVSPDKRLGRPFAHARGTVDVAESVLAIVVEA